MMNMNLKSIYCSGSVQRYHTNPWLARSGQTNADHQGRVVQILIALFPTCTMRLLRAAAFHDVGERRAADLPAGIGRNWPELKAAHKIADAEERAVLMGDDPVGNLTSHEARILRFCDQLEPIFYMLMHAPAAAHHEGWAESEAFLLSEARDLLTPTDLAVVMDALRDLRNGNFM